MRKWSSRLVGSTVTGIRTHGKHLIIDADSGVSIHVWLGMSGRFQLRDRAGRTVRIATERPRRARRRDDPGAIRLMLSTSSHQVICHAAPTVDVERTRVVDRELARLGADVLAESFDWELFRARAGKVSPDRSVADLLLDQRVLAGVGNEYKNEVLFLEGLHPLTPLGSLDPSRIDALAERARRLMLPNAHRGARVTTGMRGPGLESWVFERTGRPCRRCRASIVSGQIGDPFPRVTYWCPNCQADPN